MRQNLAVAAQEEEMFAKALGIILALGTLGVARVSAQGNCQKAAAVMHDADSVFVGGPYCDGKDLSAVVSRHWGNLTCDAKEHYFIAVRNVWHGGGRVKFWTTDGTTVAEAAGYDDPDIRYCKP
jgi:hypothetical protein